MKTAQERVDEVMEKFDETGSRVCLRGLMLRAFKEQDGDTRHACAEAVSLLRGQMGEGGDPFCAAHAACMNVKAV